MLKSLSINNFAIIEEVTLDFEEGMTILSGETGAGKSIIIDALSLLIGGRGSSDFIRLGSQELMVEGLFIFDDVDSNLVECLNEAGFTINLMEEDLIIRRQINLKGKNIIRINGQLANVKLLKEIGQYLADIHGQNEHQLLLDNRRHIYLLDQFAGSSFMAVLDKYQEAYVAYQKIQKEWFQAQAHEADLEQRLSFLEFQFDEIEEADFQVGEEEELEARSKLAQNAQIIEEQLSKLTALVSEGSPNILSLLDQSIQELEDLTKVQSQFEGLCQTLTQARYEIEDVGHQLAKEVGSMEVSDSDIDQIEGRLSQMSQFKRKYNKSIDEIIEYKDHLQEQIDRIAHRDQYLDKLRQAIQPAYEKCLALAEELHHLRIQASLELKGDIENQLRDLYMGQSQFSVKFEKSGLDHDITDSLSNDRDYLKLHELGFDNLEFMIATNIGEPEKPLVKVASGGELSRFMLALKVVFSRAGSGMVMVFDEIDTGVSGRVAFAIAQKMYQVSKRHQVLAITHLAQVAAISDQQILIQKLTRQQRTYTQVEKLTESERLQVIGQMLAGQHVNQETMNLVKTMMNDLGK